MKTRPATAPVRKKIIARAVRSRRATKTPLGKTTSIVKTTSPKTKIKRVAGLKTATSRRARARGKKIEVPSILLEGDQPMAPFVSGPGQKYALGPAPLTQHFETAEAELPEAYGTRRLFLAARDPHWLYAHWDLTRASNNCAAMRVRLTAILFCAFTWAR